VPGNCRRQRRRSELEWRECNALLCVRHSCPEYSLVSAVAGTRAATKLSHYIRHRRNLLSLSPIASVGVRMRVRRAIHLVFVAATLASCSALPAGGPHRRDTTSGAKSALSSGPNDIAFDYALVHIDHAAVELVADPVRSVAVGDVLQVSVFESEAGVVPGNFVTLPSQTVDCIGTISVPFAGQIPAAGRTLREIQREIEARLATRAIDPRVIVKLLGSRWLVLGECRLLYETNG